MSTALQQDARNRATRTFVQGLEIDLGVSVAALVLSSVNQITTKEGLIAFGLSVVKTVLTTAASYVMRRFMDGGSVPTPGTNANQGWTRVPTLPDARASLGLSATDSPAQRAPGGPVPTVPTEPATGPDSTGSAIAQTSPTA